jgi:hypothetical protein
MLKELLSYFSSLNPQKIIGLIIFVVLCLILFPFIDTNIIQPSKLNQEIKNLELLLKIDKTKLVEYPELMEMYSDIIERMNKDIKIKRDKKAIPWWLKFLAGGSIAWLLIFLLPFVKYDKGSSKFLALILILIIGCIFGGIGLLIPSFEIIQINLFLYPGLQLILLITIAFIFQQKKLKK